MAPAVQVLHQEVGRGVKYLEGLTGVRAWQVKRVVMERDTYPRRWGLGPTASKKKQMKIEAAAAGDKAGQANGLEAVNGT